MSAVQVTLDAATWGWLQISVWVAVVLIISLVASVVYHLISEFRTPAESKAIRTASHRRRPGIFLASDSGVGMFKFAKRIGHEGYVVTPNEGKEKFHYTALTPRQGAISSEIKVNEAGGKDLSKTQRLAEVINKLNTKKLFLQGARIPVWFAVPSKGIVASIYAIAALQISEDIEIGWSKIKAALGDTVPDVYPIDNTAIKRMVENSSYNESQINSIESDSEHVGEERAKKAGFEKWFIIGGLAMMGIGVAALVAAAFIAG